MREKYAISVLKYTTWVKILEYKIEGNSLRFSKHELHNFLNIKHGMGGNNLKSVLRYIIWKQNFRI